MLIVASLHKYLYFVLMRTMLSIGFDLESGSSIAISGVSPVTEEGGT